MISLRFFGTGGLEAARIRNKLSKDYRRFPTLLIDERILIDPSEDIFEFVETFMLSGILDEVRDVFITHSHLDSFSASAIETLAKGVKLRVYASETLKEEISSIENVEFIEIDPFSLHRIGGFSILALPANHATDVPLEKALNFLIEAQGKSIFYGIDGAFIDSDAFRVLKEIKLDVAILDFALGLSDYSRESANHNNLSSVQTVRDVFLASGVATEDTKFILSHIPSGKKHPTHDEIREALSELPFTPAYDGYFLGV